MTREIDIVVNPRAGRGRAEARLGDMTRELARVGFSSRVHATERPGHASDLVRGLIDRRVATIGIMGGDGTVHEALNGLVDSTSPTGVRETQTAFAILPAGTGGDYRKTFKIPDEPAAIARYVASAQPTSVDAGFVDFVAHDGTQRRSIFANIASFGVGGLVDQVVAAGPRWLGGKAAYLTASLRAGLRYTNAPVRVVVDDEVFYEGPVLNVAVANGRAFGGGMFIAPDANPSDGLFDVVILGDLSFGESVLLSSKIYKGTHVRHRKVFVRRGRVVRASKLGVLDALMDIDGEAPGRIDANFVVVPRAVTLLVQG